MCPFAGTTEGAAVGTTLEGTSITLIEDGLGPPADGIDTGVATEEEAGLLEMGATTGGLEEEGAGTAGLDVAAALETPTRGGVHRGGAFVGRSVLGVCENCGAVHAGVANGLTKTVTVTVTVACWRFSSGFGRAKAPTASAEVRRAEECIVKKIKCLQVSSCVVDICLDAELLSI